MSSLRRAAMLPLLSLPLLSISGAEARRLPPKPTCLEGQGAPRFLQFVDPQLQFCTTSEDSEKVSCYRMHLDSGNLYRSAPLDALSEKWKLDIGESDVQICKPSGGDCKTVRASGEVDPGLGLSAELNSDGSRVALAYLGDDTTVETFEVATGKKLMELHGRAKKAMCIYASFVGESVLVQERDCGSDALSASWLAGPDGKRLADAGGGKAFATSQKPAHISGDDWAFPAARGEAIAIQDVKTGKVKKKIALGKKGEPAVLIANERRIAAAFEGKRLGEVAVIDVASGYKIKKLTAARCSK